MNEHESLKRFIRRNTLFTIYIAIVVTLTLAAIVWEVTR